MAKALNTLPRKAVTAALCTTALLFASSGSRQTTPQTPSPTADKAATYFPPGLFNGIDFYIADFLSRAGEPSLRCAAQDPSVLSYRLSFMGFVPERTLAVRLFVDSGGTARISSAKGSVSTQALHKAANTVSVADVHKFLRRVDKANFWSMPANEPENPDPRRGVYKVDASVWIFEGVRNGTYHVVVRRGPESSPFTEMVLFLTNDLAGLDVRASPRSSPPTPTNP